ncbi:MAG: phosphoribosylformylglycinamidine cyclo-ligase [Ferrovum myxofaciens]|nr:phosphoribosylformylglycinamidine cyclo-ligase [Ferrovum myxofaciens]
MFVTVSNPFNAGLSYRSAGVDIDAGDALVERIKPFARRTLRPEVVSGIGGFAALVEIGQRYKEPVLVSGTDGVGTKLRLAFELNRHEEVGVDLVAMSVNDILVQGAEPLFFLDYFACGRLDVEQAATVIEGIARGCEEAGCALIGGETAEMPDSYPAGEYDLAGFAVGVAEKSALIDGSTLQAGDCVIGVASSGAHSNGFSLIRKIVSRSGADLKAPFPGGTYGAATLADVLMTPTRLYVKPVLALMKQVTLKGMAHITGGGLVDNLPRVIPAGLAARLERARWPRTPLFEWLQRSGDVTEEEMLRVFNCGVGLALVVASQDEKTVLEHFQARGWEAWSIGEIVPRPEAAPATWVE